MHPVNFELDFEYVLYNHLIQLSNFLAQGKCDLESMIAVYEQYAINQLSRKERETLRKFKQIISKIEESLEMKYTDLENNTANIEELARIRDQRDSEFDELERLKLRYLLRWLVACTRKKFKAGSNDPYTSNEFFKDLKLELSSIFGEDVCFEVDIDDDDAEEFDL